MSVTTHTALLTVSGLSSRVVEGMTAVQQLSFTQQTGEKIAIAGETGSGKTTLLKMLAGLVQPHTGTISLDGKRIKGPDEQLIAGHRAIAYLSQYFELRNNYWVHEILAYANELGEKKARQLYDLCQVAHLLQRRTNQLSGGEKQRVALARLLSTAPQLLLLDEPFSNLDMGHKTTMKALLAAITTELNISCILVSHDPADLLPWADTLFVMQDGSIIQRGSPKLVYRQPVNEYAAALLGPYNLIQLPQSPAFAALPGLKDRGGQCLIRPEQFTIATAAAHQLSGVIQQVLFRGAFDTALVLIDGQSLQVNLPCNSFAAGEQVFLSLPADGCWFF